MSRARTGILAGAPTEPSVMMDATAPKPRVNGSMIPKYVGQYVCVVAKNLGVREPCHRALMSKVVRRFVITRLSTSAHREVLVQVVPPYSWRPATDRS